MTERADIWWKNAIFYGVDVAAFYDSDSDGVGDFRGLTSRLDYLAGLGVTCLWVMPCYPSPLKDDGYDIADFYSVHPMLGSLGDFVEFVQAADSNGIRVLLDLVANHTSDQHPWFQSARKDANSPYRDWYIWSDEPAESYRELVFPGEEDRHWTHDPETGQYYRHRFYSFEPDLNMWNEEIREEIYRIMRFWLALGVSGFRVDAAPYLLDSPGYDDARSDPHDYLRRFRAFVSRRQGDAILVGEANLDAEEQGKYFGSEEHGDELHMLFNFVQNRATYLALAREDPAPLVKRLNELPRIPFDAQWLNFARTHDELNFGGLSQDELADVFEVFGGEPEMRIYGRGLRRRVAPMLEGDRRRIELLYSLLFSLPGAPMLLWGEEIGMGDDPSLPGRLAVRSPMQWANAPNGGFSAAPAEQLFRPLVTREYGYDSVNVADQRRSRDSLLNWMERLIRMRKLCPEFGWGLSQFLDTGKRAVLGQRSDWRGGTVFAFHNLAHEPCEFDVDVDDEDIEAFVGIFGEDRGIEMAPARIELGPYGYLWLRARKQGQYLVVV